MNDPSYSIRAFKLRTIDMGQEKSREESINVNPYATERPPRRSSEPVIATPDVVTTHQSPQERDPPKRVVRARSATTDISENQRPKLRSPLSREVRQRAAAAAAPHDVVALAKPKFAVEGRLSAAGD